MSRYNNDGGYISSDTSTSLINDNNVHENNNNAHEISTLAIITPSFIRCRTKVIAKVKTLKENDENEYGYRFQCF